jgi:hypothetical protein
VEILSRDYIACEGKEARKGVASLLRVPRWRSVKLLRLSSNFQLPTSQLLHAIPPFPSPIPTPTPKPKPRLGVLTAHPLTVQAPASAVGRQLPLVGIAAPHRGFYAFSAARVQGRGYGSSYWSRTRTFACENESKRNNRFPPRSLLALRPFAPPCLTLLCFLRLCRRTLRNCKCKLESRAVFVERNVNLFFFFLSLFDAPRYVIYEYSTLHPTFSCPTAAC